MFTLWRRRALIRINCEPVDDGTAWTSHQTQTFFYWHAQRNPKNG